MYATVEDIDRSRESAIVLYNSVRYSLQILQYSQLVIFDVSCVVVLLHPLLILMNNRIQVKLALITRQAKN